MESTTAVLNHPDIGNVKGIEDNGVLQFRGIQYGVLKNWLDNARLPIYDGNGLDATQYGPSALSSPGGLDVEQQIIQQALPRPTDPGCSATLCLNLNLTVPSGATATSGLPVLVFIHGGGFFSGGNWWPQYDTRRLVRLSTAQGRPLIVANINYRLGMAGFLTSRELRDAGYRSNNGHHDQRLAMEWIREHISGFGGNPERITASGESIGGLSALRLLHPDENLVSRLIVFAGAPPLMNPQPLETAEPAYLAAIKALGLDDLATPRERVAALLAASPDILSKNMEPSMLFSPLVDGILIECEPTFETITQHPPWEKTSCKAIMVGYAPLDASVLGLMGLFQRKNGIGAAFATYVRTQLARYSAEAERLLRAYGIGIDDGQDDTESLIRILTFASDIGYRAPAYALARSFPGEAFLLEFSEPNPWGGAFKGHTTHVLDVAFLFQNYNDRLDAQQAATAVQLASDVIRFVHGIAPWTQFSASGPGAVAVIKNGNRVCKDIQNVTTDKYGALEEIGVIVGYDCLADIVVSFVFGPHAGSP